MYGTKAGEVPTRSIIYFGAVRLPSMNVIKAILSTAYFVARMFSPGFNENVIAVDYALPAITH
jgi:hypothetical protein